MFFDIAVIGAGPSGISAALTGARQGMRTVLCTDRPVLGGNSSSEIRVWTRGATGGGNLFAEEMGTLGELKLRNLALNPGGNVLLWDETLLDAVLAEPLLTLYLNLPITEVCVDSDGMIRSIAGWQLASGSRVELTAGMYIDCTGDGEIAYRAGVPYRMGREGRGVYGEDLAAPASDHELLGCSILWQTKRVGHPVPFSPPAYAYSLEQIEGMLRQGGRIVTADMQGSDCWWFEFGGCMNTVDRIQDIHLELRRIVLGLWHYIKNSGKFSADDLQLEWIGALPGKRESRRFEGLHTLTQTDIQQNRFAGRAVAYGGWFMDTHPAEGIFSQEDSCVQPAISCYGIPIDCFFHPGFPNLLFSGRAASVSHQVFTSYRIMNTCGLAGDACAMAASLCLREKRSLMQLAREPARLVELLAREDVVFDVPPPPGLLADAQIAADSSHPHAAAPTASTLALEDDVCIVLPISSQRAAVYFHAQAPCRVGYQMDSHACPSRLLAGTPLARGEWQLHGGLNRVEVSVPETDGFCVLRLTNQPDASLCLGEWLCGVYAGTASEPSGHAPAVEWAGGYDPGAVLSGFTRPYRGSNGWMARASHAVLHIRLAQPARAEQVRLYFDPDFCAELTSSRCATWDRSHHYCARSGMPPQLVRSYRLYADGELIAQSDCNTRRMAVHAFSPRMIDRLRLEILDTYGGCAALYRIVLQ